VLSLSEDGFVLALGLLALKYPLAAALIVITGVALIVGRPPRHEVIMPTARAWNCRRRHVLGHRPPEKYSTSAPIATTHSTMMARSKGTPPFRLTPSICRAGETAAVHRCEPAPPAAVLSGALAS
jgi:hypothetical protein